TSSVAGLIDWYCTVGPSETLEDGGDALTAADALTCERVAPLLTHEQRRRLAGDSRTGRAERVADRHSAAVEIDDARIQPQVADAGQRLRGKGLVELDHVEVVGLESGARQRLLRGRDRTDPHDRGVHARGRERLDSRERRQPVLPVEFL